MPSRHSHLQYWVSHDIDHTPQCICVHTFTYLPHHRNLQQEASWSWDSITSSCVRTRGGGVHRWSDSFAHHQHDITSCYGALCQWTNGTCLPSCVFQASYSGSLQSAHSRHPYPAYAPSTLDHCLFRVSHAAADCCFLCETTQHVEHNKTWAQTNACTTPFNGTCLYSGINGTSTKAVVQNKQPACEIHPSPMGCPKTN